MELEARKRKLGSTRVDSSRNHEEIRFKERSNSNMKKNMISHQSCDATGGHKHLYKISVKKGTLFVKKNVILDLY